MTSKTIDLAMKDFTAGAKETYGDKLKEIILYGSCARGDFDNESDVDIMILLDIPKSQEASERQKIRPLISNLDVKYEYELLFATNVHSYDEFYKWVDIVPYYGNVKNEGVRYA